MKLKNQIINYFVADLYNGNTQVFCAPLTMNTSIAKKLIAKSQQDVRCGSFLHVCFDKDSNLMYLPNSQGFTDDQLSRFGQLAKDRIGQDFGQFPILNEIFGSPFSTLRKRSISHFRHTYSHISSHFGDVVDLPVVEANLSKMPTTVKSLPSLYENKRYMGGYVNQEVTFIEEVDNYNKKQYSRTVHIQKPPFILVNISPDACKDITEKEWAVLSGYRDYLADTNSDIKDEVARYADLYAIQRHLYLGWSYEEVSSFMLDSATDFLSLLRAISLMSDSANNLESLGYDNPAKHEYYLSFKIDEGTFPVRISSMLDADGILDPFRQLEDFFIMDYDSSSSNIIIKTSVFLAEEICSQFIRATSIPFMARYNKAYNTIDVKSVKGTYVNLKSKYPEQLAKIQAFVEYDTGEKNLKYRVGDGAEGVSLANPNSFNMRKITEYYYAYDFLKEMCKERGVEFRDLDVLVGPIERIVGSGTEGGFYSEKAFKKKNVKTPYKLTKGVYITPPLIMINSLTMPSYAQQTKTIIHEYSHYLFSITDPDHEIEYDSHKMKGFGPDHFYEWYRYLNDEDEVLAHKTEIKYCLLAGESFDEIIRDKVGGQITEQNYLIALEFKKLVDQVIGEIENGRYS